MRNVGLGLSLCLLTLAGCGQESDPGSRSAPQESASTAADVSTFYSLRPDYRRCPSPACGGSWVSRVNRATTQCADGAYRAECYVAEVQNSTGLSDEEWAAARGKPHLVRADMTHAAAPAQAYGALRASEIWNAFDDEAPVGTFYQITDKQITCFAYPCFSLFEARLNSSATKDLSGLEGRLGVAAGEHLAEGKIIVAGWNQSRSDGGKVVLVKQLYLKAEQHSPLCAEYTTADGRFYARNFARGQEVEAAAWAAADPEVVSSGVGIGTCVAWNEKPCDPQDPPVCGLPAPTNVAANYASLCELRKAIRELAGTEGEAKGKFRDGPCAELCASAYFADPPEVRFVYVQSFLWQELAEEWLSSTFPNAEATRIDAGRCDAQPECTVAMYVPVCGTVRSETPSTYAAPCRFVDAVMKDSAAEGWSKGYYSLGPCAAPSGWVTPIDVTVGSLARDAAVYYDLVVPAEAQSVEITTTGGTGDADLYVRKTVAPTEYSYDCRSWSWGNDEACTFAAAPGGVTYTIMLLGYDLLSTDIQLVARYYLP